MPSPRPTGRGTRRIDRSSPLPFYQQLKALIVADIAHHGRPRLGRAGAGDEDLTDRSLYDLLEQEYDVRLARARRVVEAAVAGARSRASWPTTASTAAASRSTCTDRLRHDAENR